MGRKHAGQASNIIESDFVEAIERLRVGKPRNKALKEKLAEGKLKLTFSNVALEAKRSRALISQIDSPYPRVRDLILGRSKARPESTAHGAVSKLRDRVLHLQEELHHALAEVVVHLKARERAVRDAEKWRMAYSRVKNSKEKSHSARVVKLVPRER